MVVVGVVALAVVGVEVAAEALDGKDISIGTMLTSAIMITSAGLSSSLSWKKSKRFKMTSMAFLSSSRIRRFNRLMKRTSKALPSSLSLMSPINPTLRRILAALSSYLS